MPDIFSLSSDVVDRLAELHPELSTALGLPGKDHLWSDRSPAGFDADRSFWTDVLERARACDVDSRAEGVAKAVLIAEAERELGSIALERHLSDLNNIASPWHELRDLFDSMPDDTVESWQNIIQRLRTIDQPLDGYSAPSRHCDRAGTSRRWQRERIRCARRTLRLRPR